MGGESEPTLVFRNSALWGKRRPKGRLLGRVTLLPPKDPCCGGCPATDELTRPLRHVTSWGSPCPSHVIAGGVVM